MKLNYTKEHYFVLFACCIPVKGAHKSLIYDIQRNAYLEINNLVYDVLQNNINRSIQELKDFYKNEFDAGIDKYFSYFIENEFGFLTTESKSFPKINPENWDSPYIINSAIVEYSELSNYNITHVLKQLESLGCPFLQLRFLDDLQEKEKIFEFIEEGRFKGLELYFPYQSNISMTYWLGIKKTYSKIAKVVFYDTPEKVIEKYKENNKSYLKIEFIEEIKSPPNSLILTSDIFFEAQKFNTGLNRKVCINKNGLIKNFIDHDKSYGNVNDILISSVVQKKSFKENSEISNDEIETCRDCQYRYMCISYSSIQRKNEKFIKLIKCNFNPYKNEWNI